ncbi:MAG: GHMP kinase [Thiomicrospira sp.]
MKTLCRAPAKLILSGEHAVLYGCPALSLAIDLPTECDITFQPQSPMQITLNLTDYALTHHWSAEQWIARALDIEARYLAFSQDQLPIEQVCLNPLDLVILTLWHFHQLRPLQKGHWHISIQSQAWSGRGMGSSAAVITSLLKSLFFIHQIEHNAQLLSLAKTIESRQHGQSSGLDPLTLIEGGLIYYRPGESPQHLTPHYYQAWLIDTGAPLSRTGECVSHVRRHFQHQHELWREFEQCTQRMYQAWITQQSAQLKQAIADNQQLLSQIGVVPHSVQDKLTQLNSQAKGVSKVCGAGSLVGEHAGVAIGLFEQDPSPFCQQWQWRCQRIHAAPKGVECVVR